MEWKGVKRRKRKKKGKGPVITDTAIHIPGCYSLLLPVLLYGCYWQVLDPSRLGNSPDAGTSAFMGLAGMGTGYPSCSRECIPGPEAGF